LDALFHWQDERSKRVAYMEGQFYGQIKCPTRSSPWAVQRHQSLDLSSSQITRHDQQVFTLLKRVKLDQQPLKILNIWWLSGIQKITTT
jgi:uncharacterized membrane protein